MRHEYAVQFVIRFSFFTLPMLFVLLFSHCRIFCDKFCPQVVLQLHRVWPSSDTSAERPAFRYRLADSIFTYVWSLKRVFQGDSDADFTVSEMLIEEFNDINAALGKARTCSSWQHFTILTI